MKKAFFFIYFLSILQNLVAQNIREINGMVQDSLGINVIAATIKLTSAKDTLLTRTDSEGRFNFKIVQSSEFVLSATSLGYSDFIKKYTFPTADKTVSLDPIILKVHSELLNEVIVSGNPSIVIKQDTVEYRAKDFPVRENSIVEDIIKKLPGVEVDKNGKIVSQGKSIVRVRVNGKDYFSGDVKSATQGLPADIIDKIQIIDDYGDLANITGIKQGIPEKIINLTIRPDRMKGHIISGQVGGGNEDRFRVGGSSQILNQDRQIDIRLNANNINASPFDFDMGGSSGGFGGGGGINNTTGGGINFRDQLTKKISVNGSYRYNLVTSNASSNSLRTSRFGASESDILKTSTVADSETSNQNHNTNLNVEYKINEYNYLQITPSFDMGKNESEGFTTLIQQQTLRAREDLITNSVSNSTSPTFGGNIMYNHRFKKTGRNFSFNLRLNSSDQSSGQNTKNLFQYYNSEMLPSVDSNSHRFTGTTNKQTNSNAQISYSEPLGKTGNLDFIYTYSIADYKQNLITDVYQNGVAIMNKELSNSYNYSLYTNRVSLSYRNARQQLYNYTIGMTTQPTMLKGYTIPNGVPLYRKRLNFFPTARFNYNFGQTRSLNINYDGNINEPAFNQIQPVKDISNPLRPLTGNPKLNSAFTQSINIGYNTTDIKSGFFFSTAITGSLINNQITNNTFRYDEDLIIKGDSTRRTIEETSYVNTNGSYSTNVYYSMGKPLFTKKYRLSLNGGLGYANSVSFANSVKNLSKNRSFSQNMRVQINPNQNVEFNPSIGYTATSVKYSVAGNNSFKATTWNYDLSGKIYFLKSFIVGLDLSKRLNKGYGSINANPFIIDTYLEKQFFNRSGTLRIQGFDLLNQNTVVAFSADPNATTSSQTNRLTRYFMAALSFKIQKFPTAK